MGLVAGGLTEGLRESAYSHEVPEKKGPSSLDRGVPCLQSFYRLVGIGDDISPSRSLERPCMGSLSSGSP